MKKNSIILAVVMFAVAGCETWDTAPDETYSPRSGILNEPAGAQSFSSAVNPSGSSRNVGQSGATTNRFSAPITQPENALNPTNEAPQP